MADSLLSEGTRRGTFPKLRTRDESTVAAAVSASRIYVATLFVSIGGLDGPIQPIMSTWAGGTRLVPVSDIGRAANAINDAGLIVGNSGSYAFLSDGKLSWDLNTLIDPRSPFLLQSATDIDAAGRIIAQAYDSADHSSHLVLLTPEPSTLLVLGAGLALASAARHRARRRSV